MERSVRCRALMLRPTEQFAPLVSARSGSRRASLRMSTDRRGHSARLRSEHGHCAQACRARLAAGRAYDLPPAVGNATDSRAAALAERLGELVQVELEALPPEALRDLVRAELVALVHTSTIERVREREQLSAGPNNRLHRKSDALRSEQDVEQRRRIPAAPARAV